MWIPTRIWRSTARAERVIAAAQRTAREALSKIARKPSPVVLTSRPRNTFSSSRNRALWLTSKARQASSPRRSRVTVESTMSVNITVARIRSPVSSMAASMARPLPPHSRTTHGSSPTTHLSWPGGISNTAFGPTSSVAPLSMTTRTEPDIVYPKWRTWQVAV